MSVVKKLFRDLGEFTVDIKDWEILDQGVNVLWGPSGAGKTTILNALIGLDPLAKVSWVFKGEAMEQKPISKRNLGVVFQDLGLFPHMSAEKNILFPIHKKAHPHWQDDFNWLVDKMELGPCLNRSTGQLSGGEKQRVAMARALIYRPQMLLLDEPFSSLDEDLRERARDMVLAATRYLKCPVLLVTHDRVDVEKMADRVCQIELGKILSCGATL